MSLCPCDLDAGRREMFVGTGASAGSIPKGTENVQKPLKRRSIVEAEIFAVHKLCFWIFSLQKEPSRQALWPLWVFLMQNRANSSGSAVQASMVVPTKVPAVCARSRKAMQPGPHTYMSVSSAPVFKQTWDQMITEQRDM
ncbi:hypothetical protein ILYODFUR_021690 [Ilyodon furcidens]|uniref:Uncharacterized protein n=1 Tax=Ilyodon furcidens TaxID=33524 RepID=A0ABV0UA84_9TELE